MILWRLQRSCVYMCRIQSLPSIYIYIHIFIYIYIYMYVQHFVDHDTLTTRPSNLTQCSVRVYNIMTQCSVRVYTYVGIHSLLYIYTYIYTYIYMYTCPTFRRSWYSDDPILLWLNTAFVCIHMLKFTHTPQLSIYISYIHHTPHYIYRYTWSKAEGIEWIPTHVYI